MSDPQVLRAVGFVVGVVVTLIAGAVVPYVARRTRSVVRLAAPSGISADRWQVVTDVGDDVRRPIEWQGKLERVLFFTSFWLPAYEIAGGWLAFKLASKWQAWQTMTRVPEMAPNGVDPMDYLAAKNRWASATLQWWLLGNLLNLLVAFLGVAVSLATQWALRKIHACQGR